MMKILNFGSCNIDYVYSLDHIVAVGETETTHKLETFPGGKGLNQSIAVSRAGAKVYHAGCVGVDGGMLTDILAQSGVDISYIKEVDSKNGHAIIQVSAKGDNSIFLYPGSNEMLTKELIDSVLESFSAGDLVLLQNEINLVPYIVDRAYEKGMQIVLNPSPYNEVIGKLDLTKLSYIILNEVEAKEISGSAEPEEALAYFRSHYPDLKVMLTLGGRGCVYMDKDRELRQAAFRVEAVDTTAAGDTFTGYFLAGIAEGADYGQVLKLASAAAAISVSRMGAAPSIPERAEVEERMGELRPSNASSKNEELRGQIEAYIEQKITGAKLEELAKELGYSAVYTGSLVKKLTGKTFSKLLQSKRCSVAAKLLAETELSVEEIISTVGYENESFFREVFREKYGKKPLEFRKAAKGE